jgi:hypothetical protein
LAGVANSGQIQTDFDKISSDFDQKQSKKANFALPILTFFARIGPGAVKNSVRGSQKGQKAGFRGC